MSLKLNSQFIHHIYFILFYSKFLKLQILFSIYSQSHIKIFYIRASFIFYNMQPTRLPGTFIQLKKCHTGPIYAIKFNNSGEYVMTGSEDRSVCLYNPHKNIHIKTYKNLHNYDVSSLSITNDNSKFATGGGDKNVMITDVVQGKSIRKFSGHNGRVNSICFNDAQNILVSGSYDTTVKFWDNRANAYHPIDVIKGFKDSVSKVEVRGTQIICCSMDGSVRFYEVRTGRFLSDQFNDSVQYMAVSNSSRAYIASTQQNSLILVDKTQGKKVMQYKGHEVNNFSIQCCFNEQDSYVYSGSANGKLYIYDIMKNQPAKVIAVSSSPLSALDTNQKSGLIGGSHNGCLYYWKF